MNSGDRACGAGVADEETLPTVTVGSDGGSGSVGVGNNAMLYPAFDHEIERRNDEKS